ncbi:MAG: NADH pyrophosphatase, decaps 5'-NAD modified RNA [uncultured Nocardioidaceae bacterium]|uniref:NAD(+) diphosphatase n=1 Tax=uncultured Nocardioidaceae bacterium TaxID=253824 RepID=A0A6J4MYM6_9ACTN|nr:MAG: NADH pyrophosphatase, decaps 5'-NAD modified RNA [uncultured Nocardioidaceae bacterium]
MTSDALLPDFPFRYSMHDRLSERRSDQPFVDRAWGDPATRVLVVRGVDLAAADDTSLRWVAPAQAPAGERVLLGADGDVVRFAVLMPADDGTVEGDGLRLSRDAVSAPAGPVFQPLRRLAERLSDLDASYAVHAAALAGWHRRHPRCSVCGADTEIARAGEVRHCGQCGTDHFPRTDPAVIMTVLDDDGRCLLGHNSARADNWYSTLAGFVEPGETPEEAVAREVCEEVGVQVDRATYLASQPWPFPSSLMLGFEAHARTTPIRVDGTEITQARWFSREELRAAVVSGEVVLPTAISIAGALISRWYGDELPVTSPRATPARAPRAAGTA